MLKKSFERNKLMLLFHKKFLILADDFLESISELFGMTEEHNDNVSTEVVSETSVNEVAEVEVYEEISLFDFV